MKNPNKVYIYDTTLRDGAQAEDVSFTVEDKLRLLQAFDEFGIHYVEGGWPGSNPRDIEFFKQARKIKLKHSRLVAFGSTHHARNHPKNDANLKALLESKTPVVTVFGKTWDFHVTDVLNISLRKNLQMIETSLKFLKDHRREVIYDAEHFFDGYKANPDYALQTLEAAEGAKPDWIILCDTNGGTLPHEVEAIIQTIRPWLKVPFGIHCHNDSGVGVANSLAAVQEGATQVQGTINGYGERCGNGDLITIMANLQLKMAKKILPEKSLRRLQSFSRLINSVANLNNDRRQPFVGNAAFAHKGGVHVSAVQRNARSYEHIDPASVGNRQRILISDLAGKGNILYKAKKWNLNIKNDDHARLLLNELKHLENEGYQFEGAEGSLKLWMQRSLGKKKAFFQLLGFRVIDELRPRDHSPNDPLHTEAALSEATIMVAVDGKIEHTAAKGHGPIDALNKALRKSLEGFFPQIRKVKLIDYKVRVLPNRYGTASKVRVIIDSTNGENRWGTVGVSENIILASWQALVDSLEYQLTEFPSRKTKRKSNGVKKRKKTKSK